ncbi:MAG: NADP-dependent oxidoreductase [bacterium]
MGSENPLWRLARKPAGGWPVAQDFTWQIENVPEPGPNQMLTRTIYLSLDPYQWGRRRAGVEAPGDVCHGRTISQVVRSRLPDYEEGDYVFNTNGWQTFGLTGEGISTFGYMLPRKIDPTLAPISTGIGVLGMLGLTAYAGLIVQCQPQSGETVVVSAASGGVGQVVGQLAKLRGARVVGIAGAAHKCKFVVEALGFDACVSHQSEHLAQDLHAACPDGCDVYFENVGGPVYEAVLPRLNEGARISLCGFISQYGNTDGKDAKAAWHEKGAAVFQRQNVTAHELFVGNFVKSHQDQFLVEMADYVTRGLVQYREDRWQGLEQAPAAFSAMLSGGNFGKSIVVAGPEAV